MSGYNVKAEQPTLGFVILVYDLNSVLVYCDLKGSREIQLLSLSSNFTPYWGFLDIISESDDILE